MAARSRGTAITETVLVIPVLLVFVSLTPWLAHMFLDLLVTRTEAHRDTFDKASAAFLLPDAMLNTYVIGAMPGQFGDINPTTRKHAFANFPPAVPAGINALFGAPGAHPLKLGSADGRQVSIDLYGPGFPNSQVEGWEYTKRPLGFDDSGDIHFMSYGSVIRSPWTWLGWPWVATQDLIGEPKKMQDWQGNQALVDKPMRTRYKLAE